MPKAEEKKHRWMDVLADPPRELYEVKHHLRTHGHERLRQGQWNCNKLPELPMAAGKQTEEKK